MRHTYATMGLMSGVKPGFMTGQMCHSLRMFFMVYAKWISGANDDREMAKLEKAISKVGEFPGELQGKSREAWGGSPMGEPSHPYNTLSGRFIAYRGFESPSLRQDSKAPCEGAFSYPFTGKPP
jgi:hypothetical protein